jgi:hypothetical protein
MNFYVDVTKLEANQSYYAKIVKVHTENCFDKDGNPVGSIEFYIPMEMWVTDKYGTKIVAEKIAAKEMNCDIQVQIFKGEIGEDGIGEGTAVSTMTNKSLVDYAMYLIENSNDDKLKTAMVDMLNYGAQAQIYFNHDVGELANRKLTAEQQSYASAEVDTTKTAVIKATGNYAYDLSLSLEDKVHLNLWFANVSTIADYDQSKLDAVITYTDFNGKTVTYEVENEKLIFRADDKFKDIVVVPVDTLTAADMNTVVTCELRYNGEVISAIQTNIAYYCYVAISKARPEIDLCKMIMKYGQSAYNYFNK